MKNIKHRVTETQINMIPEDYEELLQFAEIFQRL